MTKQEMTDKFGMLYGMMASSNDVKQMRTFGNVHKKMMALMIENKPELAEEFIEELCSIRWRQYLTRNEAMEVVRGMVPEAPWDYTTWEKAMDALHLEKEREWVFNCYALWVAMNQIYTDFGENLLKVMGADVSDEKLIPVVHDMAVSLLTDPDGKYCIRDYHLK